MNGSTLKRLIAWIKDGDSAYFNGDIAIGHNNPSSRLHIKGAGATSATSALKVENSAGSILLNILNNGKIGVNKEAPVYDMDIVGDLNFTGNLLKNGAAYNPGSQWTTSGSNIYFNSGNVGVGTSTPIMKLHVYDAAPQILTESSSGPWTFLGAGTVASALTWNQNTDFIFATNDTKDWTSISEKMRITSAGNVGIGTTSPGARLAVEAPSTFYQTLIKGTSSGNAGGLYIQNNVPNTLAFEVTGSTETSNPNAGIIYTRDSLSKIQLGSGRGAPQFTLLTSSGNIGIGIANPNSRLHLYNSAANAEMDLQSVVGAGNHWALYNNLSDNSFRIWGNNDYLSILRNGNIGIGTTNPGGKLHIYNSSGVSRVIIESATAQADMFFKNLTGNTTLRFDADSNGGYIQTGNYAFTANQPLYFSGYNGNQGSNVNFNFANSYFAGNVGIGITTPTAKLDINSDILRLRTAKTPATAGASGNAGDICWDSSYFYICVATNTWKRATIATW